MPGQLSGAILWDTGVSLPRMDTERLLVTVLASGSSLPPANWPASLEVCAGMTYLGLCKAYPRVELKIPDGPRGRFLSLKEAERYLYGEGYFLTLFSLMTF